MEITRATPDRLLSPTSSLPANVPNREIWCSCKCLKQPTQTIHYYIPLFSPRLNNVLFVHTWQCCTHLITIIWHLSKDEKVISLAGWLADQKILPDRCLKPKKQDGQWNSLCSFSIAKMYAAFPLEYGGYYLASVSSEKKTNTQ